MKLNKAIMAVSVVVALATICIAQPRMFPLSSLKAGNFSSEKDSDPLSDFPDKGLPEPSIIGANPSLASGAVAAQRIMRFDNDALSVLTAALQKGGFYIIDEREKILYMPLSGPGLDISFFHFEVAGMLRGTGLGVGSSLDKLAKIYAGNGSEMSKEQLAQRMLTDIRGMRNSKDPHILFLAGLLFEMSRLSPGNGDLAADQPAAIKFNMIQASIIERLLVLDLFTKFDQLGGNASYIFAPQYRMAEARSIFVNASWTPPDSYGPCDAVSDISTLKKTAKTGKKVVDTVKTFSELTKDINTLDKIQNSQTVKGVSIVNAALAWAKVIMAMINMEATFDLEQPMPLIRTKKSGNNVGEVRTAKIKVVMDFGHSDFINCMGKAFGTATGVNFSVPKGGPLKGVPVEWEVLLTGKGYERFTSVPTFIDAADRGDISRQHTDDKGESTVKLTGKPQPTDLSNQPVVPLPKTVRLKAKVAVDKMDAKNDIPKVLKLGIGATIDPLAVIELVADVVAKIPLKSYNVAVPVRDWQPCTADWGGSVTYKKERKQSIVVKGTRTGNGNSTGDGFRQISEVDEATIGLNPRSKEEIAAGAPRKPASYYVRGTHSDIFTGKREADPCCGPLEGKYDTVFCSGKIMTYSQVVSSNFDVRLNVGQRDFGLSFGLGTPSFPAMNRDFLEIDKSNCPLDKESAYDNYDEGLFALSAYLEDGRYGERYFDETGEILVGSKKIDGTDGSTVSWSWELARCGK